MDRRRYIVILGTTVITVVLLYGALRTVFAGDLILPQYFSIGSLAIHYYGITMALAVGAGWWLAQRRAAAYGISLEQVDALSLWLLGGAFVGARLYHVFSSFGYYADHPLEAFMIWHGGLSIFGALIGGIIVIIVWTQKFPLKYSSINTPQTPSKTQVKSGFTFHFPLSTFHFLDWLAPSFVLGQIIGRFGNLFNYEAFGYPTNMPWKMFVPDYFRPERLMEGAYFHPLFLYEAVGNALILFILLRISAVHPKKGLSQQGTGTLFFAYIILYNALRFGLEHLRIDSTFITSSLRLNVVVSACLLVAGLCGMLYIRYASTQTSTTQEP